MTKIDADLNVTGTNDAEILSRWLPLGIRKNYKESFDRSHSFIGNHSHTRYLIPIYRELIN